MATTVQILTTNYSGETANITFLPCSGGTIDLGTQVLPYNYINYDDNYQGDYLLYFSNFNETCTFTVPCSTPTPTPEPTATPEPTSTPTPTPNPGFAFSYQIDSSGQYFSPSQACENQTTNYTVYTQNPTLSVGDTLYSNTNFTSIYSAGIGNYFIIEDGVDRFVIDTNGSGQINSLVNCNDFIPTPTPTPTATPTPTPEPTATPTPTPIPVFSFIGSGYGNTFSETCFDASQNSRILYSNCDSLSFGIGCFVYYDTFPNALTGYSYVQMNEATWNINSSTGMITSLAAEQC